MDCRWPGFRTGGLVICALSGLLQHGCFFELEEPTGRAGAGTGGTGPGTGGAGAGAAAGGSNSGGGAAVCDELSAAEQPQFKMPIDDLSLAPAASKSFLLTNDVSQCAQISMDADFTFGDSCRAGPVIPMVALVARAAGTGTARYEARVERTDNKLMLKLLKLVATDSLFAPNGVPIEPLSDSVKLTLDLVEDAEGVTLTATARTTGALVKLTEIDPMANLPLDHPGAGIHVGSRGNGSTEMCAAPASRDDFTFTLNDFNATLSK